MLKHSGNLYKCLSGTRANRHPPTKTLYVTSVKRDADTKRNKERPITKAHAKVMEPIRRTSRSPGICPGYYAMVRKSRDSRCVQMVMCALRIL
jgi:hypothetical protein